ncbi:hypothetical protein K7711_05320 [Nocardia sp. CA2R105]|uniref:WXG100 family type VII secretion target n=1 Tax=Nocardia coffeae TaxID=2873381 RepID=UPI001CA63D43|nr:hypothetical protein [Nocardia coffeae]MBY8855891.1 hypothetical protein [Nocardia coffeae]
MTRWLQDDGTNHLEQVWSSNTDIRGTDIKSMLDEAAFGLEWFRLALVRYNRAGQVLGGNGFGSFVVAPLNIGGISVGGETVEPGDPDGEMRRLEYKYYDQQRGMNPESMRTLATQLQAAGSGTGTNASTDAITSELAGVKNAVPEAWEGSAGNAAQDYLAGFHAHADQQNKYLQAVASAMSGLPDVLLQIVREKAAFVVGFNSADCPVAGHAMRLGEHGGEDPVSKIITVAGEGFWGYLNDANDEVERQFHLGVGPGSSDGAHKLRDKSKEWLTDHFAPAVREAFTAFIHQCALSDYYIKQAYKPVMDLLDNQDTTTFPKPQDPAKDTNQQNGPSASGTSNSNTSTASVDQSKVPSTSTTPTSVNPSSSQSNPLSTLLSQAEQTLQTASSGVSQLTSALQSGASQLSSVLQSGMSGIFGNTTAAASSTNGSKNLASFNIGGEKVSMTQGSDGSITTTVTGLDGKSQKYTMGIKNGVPYFTPGGGDSSTQSSTTHNSTSSTGSGTGTDSAGSGSYSTSGTGGGSATQSVTSDSSQQSGSSVPSTGSSTTTTTSAYDSSTTASSSSSGTSSTGSMGHMPSTGGGGGKGSEGEHKSTGVVQSKPMWTKNPGSDRKPVIDAAAPQTSGGKFGIDDPVEQYVPNLDFEPAAVYEPDPAESPNPRQGRDSSHQPSPPPAAPVPAPTPAPAPAPTAAPRTDGVKIEIDMGG